MKVHVPDGITTNVEHAVTITSSLADPDIVESGWGKDSTSQMQVRFYVSKKPEPLPVTILTVPGTTITTGGGFIAVAPQSDLSWILWLAIPVILIVAFTYFVEGCQEK